MEGCEHSGRSGSDKHYDDQNQAYHNEDPPPSIQPSHALHERKCPREDIAETRSQQGQQIKATEPLLHLKTTVPAREQENAPRIEPTLHHKRQRQTLSPKNSRNHNPYLQNPQQNPTSNQLRPIRREPNPKRDNPPRNGK